MIEANVDPRSVRRRATALQAARRVPVEEGWQAFTHLRVAEYSGLGRRAECDDEIRRIRVDLLRANTPIIGLVDDLRRLSSAEASNVFES